MSIMLARPEAPHTDPRRDPLDVPADELRQRIRLALSILGHLYDGHRLTHLAAVLRGEVGI